MGSMSGMERDIKNDRLENPTLYLVAFSHRAYATGVKTMECGYQPRHHDPSTEEVNFDLLRMTKAVEEGVRFTMPEGMRSEDSGNGCVRTPKNAAKHSRVFSVFHRVI